MLAGEFCEIRLEFLPLAVVLKVRILGQLDRDTNLLLKREGFFFDRRRDCGAEPIRILLSPRSELFARPVANCAGARDRLTALPLRLRLLAHPPAELLDGDSVLLRDRG